MKKLFLVAIATLITTTMPNTTTQKWYDLFGRPIIGKPASKGIYITGGKKVLIK